MAKSPPADDDRSKPLGCGWDGDGDKQHYALAVVLERDPWYSALYAELRAQFELLAEAEIELQ